MYFNKIYSVDTQANFCVLKIMYKVPLCLIFDTQGYFVLTPTQKYTSIKTCLRPTVRLSICPSFFRDAVSS